MDKSIKDIKKELYDYIKNLSIEKACEFCDDIFYSQEYKGYENIEPRSKYYDIIMYLERGDIMDVLNKVYPQIDNFYNLEDFKNYVHTENEDLIEDKIIYEKNSLFILGDN